MIYIYMCVCVYISFIYCSFFNIAVSSFYPSTRLSEPQSAQAPPRPLKANIDEDVVVPSSNPGSRHSSGLLDERLDLVMREKGSPRESSGIGGNEKTACDSEPSSGREEKTGLTESIVQLTPTNMHSLALVTASSSSSSLAGRASTTPQFTASFSRVLDRSSVAVDVSMHTSAMSDSHRSYGTSLSRPPSRLHPSASIQARLSPSKQLSSRANTPTHSSISDSIMHGSTPSPSPSFSHTQSHSDPSLLPPQHHYCIACIGTTVTRGNVPACLSSSVEESQPYERALQRFRTKRKLLTFTVALEIEVCRYIYIYKLYVYIYINSYAYINLYKLIYIHTHIYIYIFIYWREKKRKSICTCTQRYLCRKEDRRKEKRWPYLSEALYYSSLL